MNLLKRNISLARGTLGIFVILILISIFLYLYNPYERARLARDQQRIEDLQSLKQALDSYLKNNYKAEPEMCDGCALGKSVFAAGPINLDTSFTLKIATSSAVNITGWLPLDFSLNAKIGETPIKVLPLDPLGIDPYVYTYTPGKNGSYKLSAALESGQNDGLEREDGGTNEDRYEIGADLTLLP